jgi:hypothetical protein
MLEITKSDLTILNVPDGDFCFGCGSACQVWPEQSTQAIAMKLKDPTQAAFKGTFFNVKVKCLENPRRSENQSCHRKQQLGIEVYTKLCFVTEKVFTALWQPPASLGIQVTTLPVGTTGGEMDGVLFERVRFPKKKVPHFIVKLTASKVMELNSCILAADEIMRPKQAKDLYKVKVSNETAKRPRSMKELQGALTMKECMEKFKTAQADLASLAGQRRLQQEHQDLALGKGESVQAVRTVRRGADADSDENEQASKKQKRVGGGAAAGFGGRKHVGTVRGTRKPCAGPSLGAGVASVSIGSDGVGGAARGALVVSLCQVRRTAWSCFIRFAYTLKSLWWCALYMTLHDVSQERFTPRPGCS